jgi:hypothetical protein
LTIPSQVKFYSLQPSANLSPIDIGFIKDRYSNTLRNENSFPLKELDFPVDFKVKKEDDA